MCLFERYYQLKLMHLSQFGLILAVLVGGVGQKAVTKQKTPAPSPWKNVETKVGPTLSVPSTSGIISTPTLLAKRISTASYNLRGWPDCTLQVTRTLLDKDEDPTDSVATKLEDTLFGMAELSEAKLSRLSYMTVSGFPAVEIEGTKDDGSIFRYRACRTKKSTYTLALTGLKMPDAAAVNHVFGSFKLAKEVGLGSFTTFGPTAQDGFLIKSHLSLWSPVTLKDSDDVPDFTGDEIKPVGFSGEFGYVSYTAVYAELTPAILEQLDEEGIDKLIASKYGTNDDGDPVKFNPFTTVTVNKQSIRTVTYNDGDVQGRVDVTIQDGKLYLFAVTVPRGMLESNDVKHFYSSISIK